MKLEDVFNETTCPEATFIEPADYSIIVSAFRMQGKHITILGQSGTGKATLVRHILKSNQELNGRSYWINAREFDGCDDFDKVLASKLNTDDNISGLLEKHSGSIFVFDDYHRFSPNLKLSFARRLKILYENNIKIVIMGIGKNISDLLLMEPEITLRMDTFLFGAQDADFTRALIEQGTSILNINFTDDTIDLIIKYSGNVPSIVHLICRFVCLHNRIHGPQEEFKAISANISQITQKANATFCNKFDDQIRILVVGNSKRTRTHLRYYKFLKCLQNKAKQGAIEVMESDIKLYFLTDTNLSIDKTEKEVEYLLNGLTNFIVGNNLSGLIYFDQKFRTITFEDPAFKFYLGICNIEYITRFFEKIETKFEYDFAISYASEDVEVAQGIANDLELKATKVFFDKSQNLLAENLTDLFENVFAKNSHFMIVILSKYYPQSTWTDLELQHGIAGQRIRGSESYIIPVRVDDTIIPNIRSSISYGRPGPDLADKLMEKLETSYRENSSILESPFYMVPSNWAQVNPDADNI